MGLKPQDEQWRNGKEQLNEVILSVAMVIRSIQPIWQEKNNC